MMLAPNTPFREDGSWIVYVYEEGEIAPGKYTELKVCPMNGKKTRNARFEILDDTTGGAKLSSADRNGFLIQDLSDDTSCINYSVTAGPQHGSFTVRAVIDLDDGDMRNGSSKEHADMFVYTTYNPAPEPDDWKGVWRTPALMDARSGDTIEIPGFDAANLDRISEPFSIPGAYGWHYYEHGLGLCNNWTICPFSFQAPDGSGITVGQGTVGVPLMLYTSDYTLLPQTFTASVPGLLIKVPQDTPAGDYPITIDYKYYGQNVRVTPVVRVQ